MARHELDLLGNAIDSLNESLRQFESASNDDPGPYKFAILHFSHFLELLLKYHVSQAHPLLVYKNPFSRNIKKEQTIGLWEAVQFLKNEGRAMDDDSWKDLEWLKTLRNNIEHHKFSMETREVRQSLGRLVRATIALNDEFAIVNLEEKVDSGCLETFKTLADEYRSLVAAARHDAPEESIDSEAHDCPYCGEQGVAVLREGRYECLACESEDELVECARCGDTYRESESTVINDDDPNAKSYLCEGCDAHLLEQD